MQHLENLRLRLRNACIAAGREPSEVRLLAVGKKHPASSIRRLYELGHTEFGENQLQEARQKQQQLEDLNITWHFVGHVQSNKTHALAEHFSWVQSVDREKILKRLSAQRPQHFPPLNILLQVNIDREPQKSGLMAEDVRDAAKLAMDLPGLRLRGLMAIPRPFPELSRVRDSFRRVRAVYEDLGSTVPGLDTLSMGMSADLEAAIAEGSTMVRIGTDLFGPRPQQDKTV